MDLLNIFSSQNNNLIGSVLIILLFVWTLFWKGLALWTAAVNSQKNWFIALLILNTVGILEIVYLFRFAAKRFTVRKVLDLVKNPKI
jgi:hypothetical protein